MMNFNDEFPEREDPITRKEKELRDNVMERIGITRLMCFPHAANIISAIGLGVFLYAVADYALTRSLLRQVYLLGIAWFTDLIDGPIARKNNRVTALGTALDHGRDYLMFSWMIALALLNIRRIPDPFKTFYLLIAISTGILLIILLKYVVRYLTLRRLFREQNGYLTAMRCEFRFFRWYLRRHLQTTAFGRGSIASFAVGDLLFLSGVDIESTALLFIGMFILFLQPVFLGGYLYETLLEPQQKILAYEQTILRLQKLAHPLRAYRLRRQENLQRRSEAKRSK